MLLAMQLIIRPIDRNKRYGHLLQLLHSLHDDRVSHNIHIYPILNRVVQNFITTDIHRFETWQPRILAQTYSTVYILNGRNMQLDLATPHPCLYILDRHLIGRNMQLFIFDSCAHLSVRCTTMRCCKFPGSQMVCVSTGSASK